LVWRGSSRRTVAPNAAASGAPQERCPRAIRDEYGEAYSLGFERTTRFLISRGVSRGNAEELSQEAWVRGWEHLHQLRSESAVGNWVNTIALNLFRNEMRRKKVMQPLMEIQSDLKTDIASIDISRILTLCRPGERALLEHQLNGATVNEVAGVAGVSRTAIRIRMLRTRRAVRARLERRAAKLRELQVFALVSENQNVAVSPTGHT
jgi:DNA-directed RNA polymerase specialized sigma24 family protein